MSVDGLFKDFGEAFGRLFDHRPVLQGEINFCQREFEEKRGNREEIRLSKSLEYGKEINEKLIPQIIEQFQTNFPKFHILVTEAVDLSLQILVKENKSEKNEWLEQQKVKRTGEWNGYLEKVTAKLNDIDKEFLNEVALVDAHYRELEEKLKISDHKNIERVAQEDKLGTDQNRIKVNQEETQEVDQNILEVADSLKSETDCCVKTVSAEDKSEIVEEYKGETVQENAELSLENKGEVA